MKENSFDLPIGDELKKIGQSGQKRFYMPGHKGKQTEQNLVNSVLSYDVTEISTTDNLYHAQGMIRESQENTAVIFGAKSAYYITNGCTGAIHTALLLAKTKGKTMLVDRNCHKSVIHGCMLFDIETEFLLPKVSGTFGITKGYTGADISGHLADGTVGAMIVTSPTYYGVVSDIAAIAKVCKAHGVLLIVDCAHGAHFGFHSGLPNTPIALGADVVAVSAHKTLPTLTQGAYLLVGDRFAQREVEAAMEMTNTSSPSYLIMASLEYGAQYMKCFGNERCAWLLKWCEEAKKKINETNIFIAPNEAMAKEAQMVLEGGRIVINTNGYLTGYDLYDKLEKMEIVCEMADNQNVVILPSVLNEEKEFTALIQAVEGLAKQFHQHGKGRQKEDEVLVAPKRVMSMKEAYELPFEYVDIKDAVGRISGQTKGIYPPGVCMMTPGEYIDEGMGNYLARHFEGTVKVVKQERGDL